MFGRSIGSKQGVATFLKQSEMETHDIQVISAYLTATKYEGEMFNFKLQKAKKLLNALTMAHFTCHILFSSLLENHALSVEGNLHDACMSNTQFKTQKNDSTLNQG